LQEANQLIAEIVAISHPLQLPISVISQNQETYCWYNHRARSQKTWGKLSAVSVSALSAISSLQQEPHAPWK
jgi:hypothetical protein